MALISVGRKQIEMPLSRLSIWCSLWSFTEQRCRLFFDFGGWPSSSFQKKVSRFRLLNTVTTARCISFRFWIARAESHLNSMWIASWREHLNRSAHRTSHPDDTQRPERRNSVGRWMSSVWLCVQWRTEKKSEKPHISAGHHRSRARFRIGERTLWGGEFKRRHTRRYIIGWNVTAY